MPTSRVFLEGPFAVDFKKGWLPAEERRAKGREARARVSRRAALGAWEPVDEVRDPVDVVMAVAAPRQRRLIPLRTARMSVSPFPFYRGAAQLMAGDLALHPHTGIYAQLCGDAHLSNFGIYASRERTPVFDINDFDETGQGPWEWDLKRLVTSFVLAARDNSVPDQAEGAVRAAVSAYVDALNEMAGLGWLERRYRMIRANTPVADGVIWTKKTTAMVTKVVSKAAQRTQSWTVAKYTETVDGVPRLKLAPPVITAVSQRTKTMVTNALRPYLESLSVERRAYLAAYHVVDVAHKVVGVGSVGAYDYIVLLVGDGEHDELLLQVKEAEPSAVKTALGDPPLLANGERVVVGSWVMQAVSDPFLGWTQLHGRSFYVRQLKDMKGSVDPAVLTGKVLTAYANRCGFTLGLAHSRAGDPDVILGYIGKGAAVADAMWAFAEPYADQTERDFGRFIEAIHDGRLQTMALEAAAPGPAATALATAKPASKAKTTAAKKRAAKAKPARPKAMAPKPKASGGIKK
jgi:uncharacterized protein (DUF2252 family)